MPANQKQQTTMNGVQVETVDIKGRPYVTVAERIKLAVKLEQGYEILSEEVFELGNTGRYFLRVTGRVNGKPSIGTAEIKLKAPANSAAGMAPMEDAQTSAIGRLLGLQGVGVLDSIATADEMRRAGYEEDKQPSAATSAARANASNVAPSSRPAAAPARAAETVDQLLDITSQQAAPDGDTMTFEVEEAAPVAPQSGRNELGVPLGGIGDLYDYATQELHMAPGGWNQLVKDCHREPDAIRAHFNHMRRTALEGRATAGKGAVA